MKEIVIRSGTYGFRTSSGRVRPVSRGERVSVPDAEAARLVGLGVAAYVSVGDASEAPSPPSDGPTPLEASQHTPGGETPADPVTDSEGDIDNDEVARLERLTKADLEQMAKDMGVDVSEDKNKHEIAVLIAAADVDGEDAPELEEGDII